MEKKITLETKILELIEAINQQEIWNLKAKKLKWEIIKEWPETKKIILPEKK